MTIRSIPIEDAYVVTPVTRARVYHVRQRINVDSRGQSFGDRVQDLRERRGLTQLQLAEAAGLSVRPIRWIEWERGKSVQMDTVARIARVLATPIEQLWYGQEATT